jgi:hypothetical protein
MWTQKDGGTLEHWRVEGLVKGLSAGRGHGCASPVCNFAISWRPEESPDLTFQLHAGGWQQYILSVWPEPAGPQTAEEGLLP